MQRAKGPQNAGASGADPPTSAAALRGNAMTGRDLATDQALRFENQAPRFENLATDLATGFGFPCVCARLGPGQVGAWSGLGRWLGRWLGRAGQAAGVQP